MSDKVKQVLCIDIEGDPVEIAILKRALQDRRGATVIIREPEGGDGMGDRVTLCFEIEGDPVDVIMLKKALQQHPGAPLWLRVYLEQALERVVKDVQDGGKWNFKVVRGVLNEQKE